MKIASLVVRTKPEYLPVLSNSLGAIPGVELHGQCPQRGKIILTVEEGSTWSMSESILAVNLSPHVLHVTLAYEYTDEALSPSQEP